MPWLINAEQMDKFRKSQKSLIIMDASWHLPQAGRDAKQEFLDKRVFDAQFFDINAFNDPNSDLPYKMISDEKLISEIVGSLGIRNDYKIIFYDNSDLHSSARALWMMKLFGHNPHLLYILDGGLKAWEKYSGKLASGPVKPSPKKYTAKYQPQYVVMLDHVKENLLHPKEQVIDVRNPARYAGGKESRPNLRSGHIPGSFSFYYTNFFDTEGKFKTLEKIRTQMTGVSIDLKAPIIATCGSAITAPILDFTMDLLGQKNHTVYSGSWVEWGSANLYPGEKNIDERPIETCIEQDCPEDVN